MIIYIDSTPRMESGEGVPELPLFDGGAFSVVVVSKGKKGHSKRRPGRLRK
jgi:hypothetical protein